MMINTENTIEVDTILLTFAHRGEARAFLSEYGHQMLEENLYQLKVNVENLNVLLLLTGEGLESSFTGLSYFLGKFPSIKRVINYGVCGLVRKNDPSFSVGDLFAVKTVYSQSDTSQEQMKFKSFTLESQDSQEKSADLITTSVRVLNNELADYLDNFAPLVDRELWAQAYSCQQWGKSLESYKVISDDADGEICSQVKEEAPLWSDQFLRHFRELIDSPSEQSQKEESLIYAFLKTDQEAFHITLSQERTLTHLLKAIQIKGIDFEELKEGLHFDDLKIEDIRAKDRTKKLITLLSESLNPLEAKLRKELKLATYSLEKAGFQIKHDKDLDKPLLYVSATIQSDEEFKRLAKALENFDQKKWQSLLRGENV